PIAGNDGAMARTFVGARSTGCSVDGARLTSSGPQTPPVVIAAPPAMVADFAAFDATLPGAVSVACGDVDGDGIPELVTGAGAGDLPLVRVWSRRGGSVVKIAEFMAYDPAFRGGVSVAVGDVLGSGNGEIVTGAGPGGGPHVRVWSVSGSSVREVA